MSLSNKAVYVWLIAIMFMAAGGGLYAGEHPEHPQEDVAKEGTDAANVTKDNLATAIEGYVANEVKLKGGYFLVFDPIANESLALTLDKVHKERLTTLGNDAYFACADFKSTNGKMYDLDIFMKGPDKDHLEVTEIAVHKEDGKERYTWREEKGVWKKEVK
jgi:hypothetical protein